MKQILVLFMFFGFLFAEDNIAKYKVKGMQCAQSCPVTVSYTHLTLPTKA